MVAPVHYDDHTLNRFLLGRIDEGESGVIAHLERCETCQSKLETLSQSEFTWDDVAEMLKPCDEVPSQSSSLGNCVAPMGSLSFLQSSEHPESLGRFGRYEIMELLGRGGMGIVMRGFDPALNRHSAIKVLAPELASSAAARRRFSREAKSAAAVVHPHVVPIQTVDEQNGLPYLVMPVVEGQSVDDRVHAIGPLGIVEVVRIAAQVAEGLAAAHEQGIVHRDIKPANVLLENGVERVQITDFGLARAIDDASMTRSGVVAGTPQYMSPEQAHGDPIDHRSDLFSLGSLIYFMCTGHSPFRSETMMGVLNRIGNDQPRSLRSINAEVPQWLEAIVFKLLSKNPMGRYQSADLVAEVLNRGLAHLQKPDSVIAPDSMTFSESSDEEQLPRWGSISRWLAAIVAGGLLALLGVLFMIETNKGTITIDCELDSVPITINKGGEVYERLTVGREGTSIRVYAGEYEIILGDDRRSHDRRLGGEERGEWEWYDGLQIENDRVAI